MPRFIKAGSSLWQYIKRKPHGWELMELNRSGKMVCRYFWPEVE